MKHIDDLAFFLSISKLKIGLKGLSNKNFKSKKDYPLEEMKTFSKFYKNLCLRY